MAAVIRWWRAPGLAVLVACTPVELKLAGRPCLDGECARGWDCHPEREICVPPVTIGCAHDDDEAICPSRVETGDPCAGEGSFVPCRDGVLDCDQGCRTCAEGVWSECTPPVPCDPDETLDRPCYGYGLGIEDPTVGVGACDVGSQVCGDLDGDNVFSWGDCIGDRVPQTEETCVDGVDDDCDGVADDGCDCNSGAEAPCYEGPVGTQDVGTCHGGTRTCTAGQWGDCAGQVTPAGREMCNGLDDDCDHATDEEPVEPTNDPCGDEGVCADGIPQCTGQEGWACEWPPEWESDETLCDGLDNDCDGQTDEDVMPPAGTCPDVGVCVGTSPLCAGEAGWACDDERFEAEEVTCDGLDNDCDDDIDEGLPSSACPACADRLDNDFDSAIDSDDPGCDDPLDNDEANGEDAICTAKTALPVPATGLVKGTTTGAGNDYQSDGCGGANSAEVVYHVPLPAGAEGIIGASDYGGTEFDSVLYIRDGCDGGTQLGCDDDYGVGDDAVVRTGWLDAGNYFVFVDGRGVGTDGDFEAHIQVLVGEGRACHPDDDYFRCAPELVCVPVFDGSHARCAVVACDPVFTHSDESFVELGNTIGLSNHHEGSCTADGGWRAPEAVYVLRLTAAATRVRISTADDATTFDTVLYVRDGCHGAEIGCNDDDSMTTVTSSLDLGALGVGDYYIFVDGWAYDAGAFKLTVTVNYD